MASLVSLRQRLVWLLVITSALALCLVLAGMGVYELTSFRPSTEKQLRQEAAVLGEVLKAPLAFQDPTTAQVYLNSAGASKQIERVVVYDAGTNFFSSFQRNGPAAKMPPPTRPAGVQFDHHTVSFWQEIHDGPQVIGWLYLEETLPPVYARSSAYIILFAVVLLVLVLVTVSLMEGLQRFFVAPLSQLVETTSQVTRKADYRIRAEIKRDDELGQLARAFNQMLETIDQRTADLQRQAEQLQLNEAFRKRVFDASRMPIVVMDPATGQFLDCNPAAAEIYHYSSCEETLGKTPLDVSAPAQYDGTPSPEKMRFYIAKAVAENTVVFEWLHQRPAGELWDAEVCLMRFHSGDRQFLQFTLQDITERRKAQAELREQAALLEASHDAVIVWHMQQGIRYMNPAAEKLTGQTLSQARTRTLSFLLRTRSSLALTSALQEVTTHGKWMGELALLASEDKPREVATRWIALKDAHGNATSVLITCNDITEQKQLQTQYLRAQRLESIGTLASGVAHDLNNILSPIMMVSDVLEMDLQDAQLLEHVAMMKGSARRGSEIVKQLLTFARGTDGVKGPIQPRHLLKEITRLVQQTFPKNIQIYSDFTGLSATVLMDPSQIHQLLMNLCVNARDAMPEGGVLSLQLETVTLDESTAKQHPKARPISYVVFKITDSGTGIPPAILERIFDPFFTTKPQGKGTGLGLSTVLGIAEQHDGFVLVESRLGEGTSFQVFIPATEQVAETAADPPVVPRARGEWVLVVDDEPAIARMTESVLRKNGYQTMSATNASEAVHLYERNHDRIRAVITDVMMPFGDGRQLIMMLYEQDPKLPIIAMSGLSSKELQNDLMKRGACKFLSKPFSAEQLLTSLAQALQL